MKVLNVDTPHATYEIHMLNPKERMADFGGSRSGLLVGKTASLVVRTSFNSGSVRDVEYDITYPGVWTNIASWINDVTGVVSAKAEVKENEEQKVA